MTTNLIDGKKNTSDDRLWNIPYYFINLDDANIDIQSVSHKVTKNNLKSNRSPPHPLGRGPGGGAMLDNS